MCTLPCPTLPDPVLPYLRSATVSLSVAAGQLKDTQGNDNEEGKAQVSALPNTQYPIPRPGAIPNATQTQPYQSLPYPSQYPTATQPQLKRNPTLTDTQT